ncbi:MAG: DUF5682 family protein [Marinisporobacter sp.]|jgi:hypothetical protein|nr:DUF5682 family protein [Marinisporobacter sp.]
MKIDLNQFKNEEIFFFPVRHHSLVSSKFVKVAIEEFKPDVILIEGPSDGNHLIENIAQSKMPVSIYGNIDDKEIKVGVNFPFFNTSPEYVAIELGFKKKIETRFIDFPVYDIDVVRDEKIDFEYSNYIGALVRKSGLESFDEYYEKYFEIGLSGKKIEDYMMQMLTYCSVTRELSPSNPYNDLRESYMAKKINEYKKKRTLVITGGFHSVVLPNMIKRSIEMNEKREKVLTKDNKNYLIPYNVQNISTLNGYRAGIYYPHYYKVFLKNGLNPRDTFVELLTKYAKKAKKQVSIPKIISAIDLAYGLASLREKKLPGVYELFDGAISTFTEFNQYIDTNAILEDFKRYLIGDEYGQVHDISNLPPIVDDFQKELVKNKFTKPNSIYTLNILNNRKAYNRSVFLSKLSYLEIEFAERIKGIDLFDIDIDQYMTQTYKTASREKVMPSVIEAAFLGESIDMAVESRLKLKIKESTTISKAVSCLKDCVVLQVESKTVDIVEKIKHAMMKESNLLELTEAFNEITRTAYHYETFGNRYEKELNDLVNELYTKIMVSLQNLEELRLEDEVKLSDSINHVYSFINGSKNEKVDRELFAETLEKLLALRWTTSLKGISLSILYIMGRLQEEKLIKTIENNFLLSENQMEGTTLFLSYLLLNNYQIILRNHRFLNILNKFVEDLKIEEFFKVLPNFRKIFTKLRPVETIRLSKDIGKLNQISENLLVKFDISQEDFERNRNVEIVSLEGLRQRGIYYE